MAQGDFTKQEIDFITDCVHKIFRDLPNTHKLAHVAALNDIFHFLETARKVAPTGPVTLPIPSLTKDYVDESSGS
jgi:hypothetical protein